ncbi:hypothetical protein GGR79_001561 [Xanthomonas arboricola]|uniref:hypothetical protein n=1 Tax=Xanthomonas arboricola TaxID=56448 RepID=UPI0014315F88|nr:hypothetical protein [Xanthomonas arboricola]NJC30094.1 hypothetical protein [Xanthomonas arboricola]
MAELWEVSAVIAMRDLQWIFAPSGYLPSAGINLAGNAESRLGDLAAAIGDRFFLFEIKPQSSKFSSEWKEKDRGGGIRRPKHAYASVLDMAKAWNGDPTATSAENQVISSLRCHHFAYWEVGSPGALDEQLCLQPYLRAVLNGSLHKHGLSGVVKALRGNLNLAYAPNGVLPDGSVAFHRCQAATVGAAHREHLGIVANQTAPDPHIWYSLGLDLFEFNAYIKTLMEGSPTKSEAINTMAISTGGWQRIMRSTDDLAELLHELTVVSLLGPGELLSSDRVSGVGLSAANIDASQAAETAFVPSAEPAPRNGPRRR